MGHGHQLPEQTDGGLSSFSKEVVQREVEAPARHFAQVASNVVLAFLRFARAT